MKIKSRLQKYLWPRAILFRIHRWFCRTACDAVASYLFGETCCDSKEIGAQWVATHEWHLLSATREYRPSGMYISGCKENLPIMRSQRGSNRLLQVALKFAILSLVYLLTPLTFADFTTPYDANVDRVPSYSPAVAISEDGGDQVYHLAFYKRFGELNEQQVYYSRSTLNGISGSWSDPTPIFNSVSVADNTETPRDVAIAANGTTILIVWQQQTKIFVARSSDSGVTFGSSFEVSSGTANFRRLPDIKVDGNGRFHMVWTESVDVGITTKYTTSATGTDGTWSAPADALDAATLRSTLVIDDTNDRIVVAAHQIATTHRIQTRSKSRDPSASWGTTTGIALGSDKDAYMRMTIDQNDDRIYLIYTDNISDNPNSSGNDPILVRSSQDQGATWSSSVEIGQGYMPAIAATAADELIAVWYDPDTTDATVGNIRFRRATLPAITISDWATAEVRNTDPAHQIHFQTSWSNIDFLLGLPGVVSESIRTTVFWVDAASGEEGVVMTQELAADICSASVSSFSLDVAVSPFSEATFSVKITALAAGQAIGTDADPCVADFGVITVAADNGTFTSTLGTISVTSSPFTFNGFLDTAGTTTLTASLASDSSINGSSNSFVVQDTEPAESELDFLVSQIDSQTNLVVTVFNEDAPDDTAHIYSNALAVIAFVHKGVLAASPDSAYTDRARNILTALQSLQISSTFDTTPSMAGNDGGFRDAYNPNDLDPTSSGFLNVPVTTGNNAWVLMAINYYAVYTSDSQFLDMARKLGGFLQERQESGGVNNGGVYSRDTNTETFVTEHQAQAFSGLFYLSEIDDTTPDPYASDANDIKLFMLSRLLDTDPNDSLSLQRFDIAEGRSDNTSLDAQTTSFLTFPGPIVNDGANDIDVSTALDFAFNYIDKEQTFRGRTIQGATFRQDDPDLNCQAVQFVWIEGSAQLALAVAELDDAGQAATADLTERNTLLENIRKVRDPSGGYPTHLGAQKTCVALDVDGIENDQETVGDSEINVAPTAWSYMNKVDPFLNPYTLDPVLIVTQTEVFDSMSSATIKLTASLRQATSVSGQSITFAITDGGGGLGATGAGTATSLTVQTDSTGDVSIFYDSPDSPDIAKITVTAVGSQAAAKEIYVLTGFVENFELGVNAGGTLKLFGNARDEAVALIQSQDATMQPLSRPSSGNFVAALATTSAGFTAENPSITLRKTFTSSISSGGAASNAIDASNFNAISYWARNSVATISQTYVQLTIGDGGGTNGQTGSTWRQTVFTDLSQNWARTVVNLDATGFTRIISNSTDGGDFDRSQITRVEIVYVSNGFIQVQQTMYVDDINFFSNDIILIAYVDRTFTQSGSNQITRILATVTNNDQLKDGVTLSLSSTGTGAVAFPNGNVTGQGGNPTGQVIFTYTAPTSSQVAKFTVNISN